MMVHRLDMEVIAEGVETQRQSDPLRVSGCDFGHGHLFSMRCWRGPSRLG